MKEYTYYFTVKECSGKYTIIFPTSSDKNIECFYKSPGHKDERQILFFAEDLGPTDEVEKLPEAITGIMVSDANFDGFTDLLITGIEDSKNQAWVHLGTEDTDYDDYFTYTGFSDHDDFNNYVSEKLGDNFTVEDVWKFISGGRSNGDFKTYNDAYKAFITCKEVMRPGGLDYRLIYFDEDDIPELVADTCGYGLSMYTFKDGYVSCLIDWWPYGAGGNAGYSYSPKHGKVSNFDQDGAGAIGYYSLGEITDGKVEFLYTEKTYAENDDVEYYGPDNMSEAQIKQKIGEINNLDFESLSGCSSVNEIFKELNMPDYSISKFDGNVFDFSAEGVDYHFVAGQSGNEEMLLCLSNGKELVEKKIEADSIKSYLFDRDGDRAFLYVFAKKEEKSKLYIYDLNYDSLTLPSLYDGKYSLYYGDITDASDFAMQTYEHELFESAITHKFALSEKGTPIFLNEISYFVKADSLKKSKEIEGYGDVIVSDKEFSAIASKDLTNTYIPTTEECMDEDEVIVTFPKGTTFYLYKIEENYSYSSYYGDFFLVSEYGYMIELYVPEIEGEIDPDANLLWFTEKKITLKDFHRVG